MTRAIPTGVGAAALTAFIVLGLLVRNEASGLDAALGTALLGLADSDLGAILSVVTTVVGHAIGMTIALIVAGWGAYLRWQGDRHPAAVLLRTFATMVLCWVAVGVAKVLFDRDRPRGIGEMSYPSGHVASVSIGGLAAIIVCVWIAPRVVRWVVAICAIAVLIAAGARVMLTMHWLTDTVGSLLLVCGVGLLTLTALRLVPITRPGPRHAHEQPASHTEDTRPDAGE